MSEIETKRPVGRPPRVEEAKTERRRRQGMGAERNLKLYVPEGSKDPDYVYRWVNDRPGRVQQLTQQDDWDKAPGVTTDGSVETRVADKSSGERTILLRKRRDFYEADKLEEQKLLDATDEQMRRGAAQSQEGLSGSEAYVPGGRAGRDGRNVVSGR